MGEAQVALGNNKGEVRKFTQHLFKDIRALEIMIENGMIEEGVQRIGAEQELCIVDGSYRPNPIAAEVLSDLDDSHFTHELCKFNIEVNLDPQPFMGDSLSQMEGQLQGCLDKLEKNLKERNSDYIMTGILPTIRRSDLDLSNLTDIPRYHALNSTMTRMRGGPYEFRIEGRDELITKHDTLMFEGCNTSFQVHFQVGAKDFAKYYNWAQAITAPVLAASTNSPVLLGKRLWRETRIALFQQSADTRSQVETMREMQPRVLFGNSWVKESVMEIFKEDVARYRVLVTTDIDEDSMQALEEGKVPQLRALRLHNGTIYKWNRACYGIMEGKPHLRIENRIFPSGPSVLDEMANAALWLGLMNALPPQFEKLHTTFDFDEIKSNFLRAAKMGMGAMFRWVDNKVYSSQDLILNELIPLAKQGLEKAGIRKKDITKYMAVIQERVETGISGSQWILDSYANMKDKGTKDEMFVAITAAMNKRQKSGKPVAKWPKAKIDEAGSWVNRYWRIDQIMSRDLYTVNQDDLIDLVPNIMGWRGIRHVPVENDKGELVGLLTMGRLLHHYTTLIPSDDGSSASVKDIMQSKLVTVTEETLTVDAIAMMRKHDIGCLLVVKNKNKLVGIVTERDFVNVADHFVREFVGNGRK